MPTTTHPPRAIEGSVGSRIRVILGGTGSKYLLLLDEDDGNKKWQTSDWHGIPSALAKQLNSCENKGRYVKSVDFDSTSEAWYVDGIKWDGSGGYSWWGGTKAGAAIKETINGANNVQVSFVSDWAGNESCVILENSNGYEIVGNVDPDLDLRIERINNRHKTINYIRLFRRGYFISDDEGTEWKGVGTPCDEELGMSGMVLDVAVADDSCWVVLRPNSYAASMGVDNDLTDALDRFYLEQTERNIKRQREIQSYHRKVLKRERAEREAQEAREREEREEAEREAREREERERGEQAEKESRERQDRELAERLAREEVARSANESESLANALEEHIKEEVKSIEESKQTLRKRQRSLKDLMDCLPPSQRARIVGEDIHVADTTATDCVVCHNAASIRAVVPCGHQCLCDDCAVTLSGLGESSRLCPLCRTPLESTLKIYAPR
jgi:hypothetical protein